MDDDDDAIFLAALEQVEQQHAHSGLAPPPALPTATLAFGSAVAGVHSSAPHQLPTHMRPPHPQPPLQQHDRHGGPVAQTPVARRQALVPIASLQQQRIHFAPVGGCPPLSASLKTSLLAENAAELQREREVQARFKAAAAEQQREKERRTEAHLDRPSASAQGPRAGATLTQSLLYPKAPPVRIEPASVLEPATDPNDNLTLAGLHLERSKTLYLPSFGREYQRAVVQSAVLSNTLVSLPTGMGKTFIAAVVMFNYLRWFPRKIVVFLAPTKPLAKQQIDSVYTTVGIPPSVTTLMTGDLAPEQRRKRWQTHRAFFLTPQVFENDISNQLCDPHRVALVVVDEAHKATGQHSIVKALKYLHSRHASFQSCDQDKGFRVLALTATPGTKVEAVQQVLTNCYISRVEVRTEEDDDVRAYMLHKDIRQEIVKPNDDLTNICDQLRRLIAPIIQRLVYKHAIHEYQANSSPFLLRAAQMKFLAAPPPHLSKKEKDITIADFTAAYFLKCQLRNIERNSIAVPLRSLEECGSKFGTLANIRQRPEFKDIVGRLHHYAAQRNGRHPKLVALENVIFRHFTDSLNTHSAGTRVMVFASGRDWVEEIVSRLQSSGSAAIKPAAFIGQAVGKIDVKTGVKSKGQTQKEQNLVLQSFREGRVNTLVCTCIGEEGLDVGEVDLIVHYDSVQNAVRNVQRSGRTGRKREGCVMQLLMEGSEEAEHRQNAKKHEEMEKTLKRLAQGRNLSFYVETLKLLPRAPKVLDAVFEIPRVPLSSAKKANVKKAGKRKRQHGLSTQEDLWLHENGYKDRAGGDPSQDVQEEVHEMRLDRHPDSQTIPTSTHTIGHTTRTRCFVAMMLRLYGNRSGTYEAEREAYMRASQSRVGLTQGSSGDAAQSLVSGGLTQGSRASHASISHHGGVGERHRRLIVDSDEEVSEVGDDAQSDEEVGEDPQMEEHDARDERHCSAGVSDDDLDGLAVEDLDQILDEGTRIMLEENHVNLDDNGDAGVDQGQAEGAAGEVEYIDSDEDIFAAYNGAAMFGAANVGEKSVDCRGKNNGVDLNGQQRVAEGIDTEHTVDNRDCHSGDGCDVDDDCGTTAASAIKPANPDLGDDMQSRGSSVDDEKKAEKKMQQSDIQAEDNRSWERQGQSEEQACYGARNRHCQITEVQDCRQEKARQRQQDQMEKVFDCQREQTKEREKSRQIQGEENKELWQEGSNKDMEKDQEYQRAQALEKERLMRVRPQEEGQRHATCAQSPRKEDGQGLMMWAACDGQAARVRFSSGQLSHTGLESLAAGKLEIDASKLPSPSSVDVDKLFPMMEYGPGKETMYHGTLQVPSLYRGHDKEERLCAARNEGPQSSTEPPPQAKIQANVQANAAAHSAPVPASAVAVAPAKTTRRIIIPSFNLDDSSDDGDDSADRPLSTDKLSQPLKSLQPPLPPQSTLPLSPLLNQQQHSRSQRDISQQLPSPPEEKQQPNTANIIRTKVVSPGPRASSDSHRCVHERPPKAAAAAWGSIWPVAGSTDLARASARVVDADADCNRSANARQTTHFADSDDDFAPTPMSGGAGAGGGVKVPILRSSLATTGQNRATVGFSLSSLPSLPQESTQQLLEEFIPSMDNGVSLLEADTTLQRTHNLEHVHGREVAEKDRENRQLGVSSGSASRLVGGEGRALKLHGKGKSMHEESEIQNGNGHRKTKGFAAIGGGGPVRQARREEPVQRHPEKKKRKTSCPKGRGDRHRTRYVEDDAEVSDDVEVSADEAEEEEESNISGLLDDATQDETSMTPGMMRAVYARSLHPSQARRAGFSSQQLGAFKMRFVSGDVTALRSCSESDEDEDASAEHDSEMDDFIVSCNESEISLHSSQGGVSDALDEEPASTQGPSSMGRLSRQARRKEKAPAFQRGQRRQRTSVPRGNGVRDDGRAGGTHKRRRLVHASPASRSSDDDGLDEQDKVRAGCSRAWTEGFGIQATVTQKAARNKRLLVVSDSEDEAAVKMCEVPGSSGVGEGSRVSRVHGCLQPNATDNVDGAEERRASLGARASSCARAFGTEVVHRTVEIYWTPEKAWFRGVIDKFEPRTGRHHVKYDDGDHRWYDFAGLGSDAVQIRWVDSGRIGSDSRSVAASTADGPGQAKGGGLSAMSRSPSPILAAQRLAVSSTIGAHAVGVSVGVSGCVVTKSIGGVSEGGEVTKSIQNQQVGVGVDDGSGERDGGEQASATLPLLLICNMQARTQIGTALRTMNAQRQLRLVECYARHLEPADFVCGMETGILRIKYEDMSHSRRDAMQALEERITLLAGCYSRAFVLVDITHDASRAARFDPIAANPHKYMQMLSKLALIGGAHVLTHEGAQHGANLLLLLARQETSADTSLHQWWGELEAGRAEREKEGDDMQDERAQLLDAVSGQQVNAALNLVAAMPHLNVLHALYILCKIPCVADLAAAVAQVVVAYSRLSSIVCVHARFASVFLMRKDLLP